ncbi:hypothetical protein WICMUC_002229 [Wickerhamomyces mucosus]|uniref:Uncharacterized protein n=1 Tax=Wickerhamomyces mucosus TaxID=1378264 RepID=A0A9P8TDW2_9ASCO|nr:hypothetical protein WICMUC_002229 [Wickerhamomyces mucosus]
MRILFIISVIALLGAGLLLFFNILCGASTDSVLGKWYWLQAETGSIPGAHATTRWTFYNNCGVENNRNVDCSSSSAAYGVSPELNFGTTQGVPPGISRRGVIYNLTRAGWVFLLLGLLFTLLTLLPVLLSLCLPSLNWLTACSGAFSVVALIFIALSASLLTAGYVKARDAFENNGNRSNIGQTMFGFIWASVALLFISVLMNFIGLCTSVARKRKQRRSDNYTGDLSSHDTYGNDYVTAKGEQESPRTRLGFFQRRKKTNPTNGQDVEGNRGTSGNLNDPSYGAGTAGVIVANADYSREPPKRDNTSFNGNGRVSNQVVDGSPNADAAHYLNGKDSNQKNLAQNLGANVEINNKPSDQHTVAGYDTSKATGSYSGDVDDSSGLPAGTLGYAKTKRSITEHPELADIEENGNKSYYKTTLTSPTALIPPLA